MRFYLTLNQFSPTVMKVIVRSKIAGEEKHDVAGICLRRVFLYCGEIDLFNVFQNWRQWSTDLLVDLVSSAIELVLGFRGYVSQLAKDVGNSCRHAKLAQILYM